MILVNDRPLGGGPAIEPLAQGSEIRIHLSHGGLVVIEHLFLQPEHSLFYTARPVFAGEGG